MIFQKNEAKIRLLAFFAALGALSCVFALLAEAHDRTLKPFLDSCTASQRVFVLDPGHGGMDGGAVAADGTPEKELTLALANDLCDSLRALGATVVMTRTTDEDTDGDATRFDKKEDLHRRAALAETYPDAVFVSVHVNLSKSARDKGFTAFYGTQNEKSESLAATVRAGVLASGLCLRVRDAVAAPESVWLQQHVKNPCLLLECGFLSNADDLALLKDETWRKKLMQTVAEALISQQ